MKQVTKKERKFLHENIHNWLNHGDYTLHGYLPAEVAEKLRKDPNAFVIMPKEGSKISKILIDLLKEDDVNSFWTCPQIAYSLKHTLRWKVKNIASFGQPGKYVLDKEQIRKYREEELVVFKSELKIPQYGPDSNFDPSNWKPYIATQPITQGGI